MSSSLTADGLRFQSLLARIDVTFSVSFIQVRKTTGERLPSAALPKKISVHCNCQDGFS